MLLKTLTVKLTKQKTNPSKAKHSTSNLLYTLQATKLGWIQVTNWKILLEKALPLSCSLLGPGCLVEIPHCQAAEVTDTDLPHSFLGYLLLNNVSIFLLWYVMLVPLLTEEGGKGQCPQESGHKSQGVMSLH